MTRIFLPGYNDVAPEVLAALARPAISQISPQFSELFQSLGERLQQIAGTKNPVYMISSTGFGMLEASLSSLVKENILVCVNGFYAEKWAQIAEAFGKKVDRLEVNYGEAITPDILVEALQEKKYDAVAICHVETSSGVINPLRELCAVIKENDPQALLLVDALFSFSAIQIEMDEWGIDFLMAASHGALGASAGLGIAFASQNTLQRAEEISDRGFYFDVLVWERARHLGSTPMMPNIPVMFALDVQLGRIFAEGLENRYTRYYSTAEMLWGWLEENDFNTLASGQYRSPTVTAVLNSRIFEFDEFVKFLDSRGMQVGPGVGKMQEKTFRIAHLGEARQRDVEILLETIGEYLG